MSDIVQQAGARLPRLTGLFRSDTARRYSPAVSLALALPVIAALIAGFLYPIARLVALSFSGETFAQYRRIVEEPLYLMVLASTVEVAFVVTAACLVLGFPVAYFMTRVKGGWTNVVAACVFVPLWTSILIRSYAWIVLLDRHGIINTLLMKTSLIEMPLKLAFTQGAVILAMTHVLMPFMILPVYSALRTLSPDYWRAARNLGAGPVRAFVEVTVPLSLPGIFAGSLMCFVLALGFYITPALVGGPGSMMMSTLIAQQTVVLLDWPFAAAVSTVLLVMTLIFVFAFRKALSFSKGLNGVH